MTLVATPEAPLDRALRQPPPARVAAPRARADSGLAGALIRMGSIVASTLLGLVLARWLGAAELGRFDAALGWAGLVGVAAVAGLDRLLVRVAAASSATGDHGHVRGVFDWSGRRLLLASALCAGASLPLALVVDASARGLVLAVGLLFVPCAAAMRWCAAGLSGFGRVGAAQAIELVLAPVLTLLALALARGFSAIDAETAIVCQGLAMGAAVLVAWRRLRAATPPTVRDSTPQFDRVAWRMAMVSLTAIALLQILHAKADIVLFAALVDDHEVGCFGVAARLANLINVALLVANAVLAPRLARAHALGAHDELRRDAVRAARVATAFALPLGLAMILAASPLLQLFGDEYAAARESLVPLVIGQVVNVAMGSVGLVLLMTGHERPALVGLAVGVAVDLLLLPWLAPRFGATGAAIARAAGLVAWNLALACALRRRLGFGVEAFSRLP